MSESGSLPPTSLPPMFPESNNPGGFEGQDDESAVPPPAEKNEDGPAASSEHINIKVTDNNNEVFFKIKRTTQLKKLMDVFCERQGKDRRTVRFLFDGQRVQEGDDPEGLDMVDGDSLEVHQEQIGG